MTVGEFDSLHARGYHLGASEVDSLSSDQYKDLLHSAAGFQRGAPESAMDRFQDRVGGSPLAHSLEHVGDLTHRIAERGGAFGTQFVKPKVSSQLNYLLSGYGWERETREAIAGNRRYRTSVGQDFPDDDEIASLLDTYHTAHSQVPIYTRPMQSGNQAALAVARWDNRGAARQLMSIESMYPDWGQQMSQQSSVEFLRKTGRL